MKLGPMVEVAMQQDVDARRTLGEKHKKGYPKTDKSTPPGRTK